MVVIRSEGAGPPRLEPARCPAGPKPASDRLAFGADHGSDALEGEASGFQTSSFLVPCLPSRIGILPAPLSCRWFGRVRRGLGCAGARHGRLFGDLAGDPPNSGMLTLDNSANGVAKIAQQVPAIGDLNSIRRTLAHAISVGSRAVASDHLDTRVLAKPCGQCFCLLVRQEIHNLVALQIHQNGSVAVASAPSPVVDSQ